VTADTVIRVHGLLEPKERLPKSSNQGGTAVKFIVPEAQRLQGFLLQKTGHFKRPIIKKGGK
jgi:hypothetical protein